MIIIIYKRLASADINIFNILQIFFLLRVEIISVQLTKTEYKNMNINLKWAKRVQISVMQNLLWVFHQISVKNNLNKVSGTQTLTQTMPPLTHTGILPKSIYAKSTNTENKQTKKKHLMKFSGFSGNKALFY